MSNAEYEKKLAQWREIQAYCRSGAREPRAWDSHISACVCDAVSWGDRMRKLGTYLLVSLAGWTPYSPHKVWLLRRTGMKIGKGVYISPGVIVDPLFPELITIEDDVLLGLGSRLLTHEYSASSFRLGRVHLGRGAVIGAWALVRSGVTVGEKATVGACSFANKDVAAGTSVGGVPARPIQKESSEV